MPSGWLATAGAVAWQRHPSPCAVRYHSSPQVTARTIKTDNTGGTVPDNISVVRSYIEGIHGKSSEEHALSRNNAALERSISLLHDECELINPILNPARGVVDLDAMPADGILRGKGALMRDIELVTNLWDIQMSEPSFCDAGDFVILKASLVTAGLKSGRSVASKFVELFFLRGERISRIEIFSDTLAWHEAL
jgi:hypothetical protein